MFLGLRIRNLLKKQYKKTNIDVSNKIKQPQMQFKSTKDLFVYSKNRCVNALKKEQPYEHALIVDTKKNMVIAEYIGDVRRCKIEDLNQLDLDKKNTAIIHGHPDNVPISSKDIKTMLNSGVYQVIAINSNGEFSLVAKTLKKDKNINKKFQEFKMDLYNEYKLSPQENNLFTHDVLSKHIPLMGLRYVSNYKCLK